jgi:hypothetical protein
MRRALLGLFTISFCLSAQSPAGRDASTALEPLKNDLQALRTGASFTTPFVRQFGKDILALSEKTHEPSAAAVQEFANGLAAALGGHALKTEEIDGFARAIESVLQSAGTSTVGFEQTVDDFEKKLMKAGVRALESHQVASSLERVGKQVRGPDDFPVQLPLR